MERILEPVQNYDVMSVQQMSDQRQRVSAQYERDMLWMSEMCTALTDHALHIDRHAGIVKDTASQLVGTRKVVSDNDKNMKEILEERAKGRMSGPCVLAAA